MFCGKCGNELPDEAKFCDKCGSSTDKDENAADSQVIWNNIRYIPSKEEEIKKSEKKIFLTYLIIAVSLIIACVVAAFVVSVIGEAVEGNEESKDIFKQTPNITRTIVEPAVENTLYVHSYDFYGGELKDKK